MPQANLTRCRTDLSDFLKSRRARLSPDDVGLPNGTRRRAPGLRREEVASLAGVGLTWYTWFEQGRDIRVSPDFLENIARALRLSTAERQHLYVLTGREACAARPPARTVSPALQRMLDGFVKYPAFIRTVHWDAIAWNKAANRLFGFASRPPEMNNFIRLCFTDQEFRDRLPNLADDVRSLVAKFRSTHAKYRSDPAMEALIEEMNRRSPEFRQLWRRYDIMASGEG